MPVYRNYIFLAIIRDFDFSRECPQKALILNYAIKCVRRKL